MITYLACPFSHPDPKVKEERLKLFYKVDANFSKQGLFTISPMNKVATAQAEEMPTTWDYWEQFSYKLIEICDKLVVITIDGWESSPGVTGEINYAKMLGLKVSYFNPDTIK